MVETSARIICDSLSVVGKRITTFELVFPRFILAEMNTHRALSRNAASSRAIPLKKQIQRIVDYPFIPKYFTKNQAGMQASEILSPEDEEVAREVWLAARDAAVFAMKRLEMLGVHKQQAARIGEPFGFVHVVCTATEWDNFFQLRAHPDAQPEFQELAILMRKAMLAHTPRSTDEHMPYVSDDEAVDEVYSRFDLLRLSAARCARVSYKLHDGSLSDPQKDLELCRKLLLGVPHWSPFEHQAQAMRDADKASFNFRGWRQLRESVMSDPRLFRQLVGEE